MAGSFARHGEAFKVITVAIARLNVPTHDDIDQAAEERKKKNDQGPDNLPTRILWLARDADEARDLDKQFDQADQH